MELDPNFSKVLVVEDNPVIMIDTVCMVSSMAGHVITARNGEEAFSALFAMSDVDLIISDWQMPVMDGMTFFDTLRRIGDRRPFLMVSGEGPEKEKAAMEKFQLDGYALFVPKPFNEYVLLRAIGQLQSPPDNIPNPDPASL